VPKNSHSLDELLLHVNGIYMNKVLWFFLAMLLVFPAFSETQTLADAKMELLQKMQNDGYLTEAAVAEARQKYIIDKDKDKDYVIQHKQSKIEVNQVEEELTWTQYLSLINFIKVFAVILLLIAFGGIIKNLIRGCWFLIKAVPVWIYQSVFLAATVSASLFPASVWQSQFFYIALFGIFGNLLIVVWILAIWEKLRNSLIKVLSFGLPLISVISLFMMIYFGVFAIAYQSSFLGFFAAIALSGVFTFSLFYVPGILFLNFKENALGAMVFGHLLALTIFIVLLQLGIVAEYLAYFNAGIQYYCTLALGVALLVGSSPFYHRSSIFYFLILTGACIAATFLYFFLNLTTLATILYIFFALVVLEWIGYLGFKAGVVAGLIVIGGLLYSTAMFLEKYSALIMNNLKMLF
jgi:hypothetical protein